MGGTTSNCSSETICGLSNRNPMAKSSLVAVGVACWGAEISGKADNNNLTSQQLPLQRHAMTSQLEDPPTREEPELAPELQKIKDPTQNNDTSGIFSSFFGCCGEDRKGSSSDKIIFTQEKGGEEGWAASADAMAIFALLDVDGSGAIEKNEFKERLRDSEDLARVFFSYCGYSEYRVVFTTCVCPFASTTVHLTYTPFFLRAFHRTAQPKSGAWSELAVNKNCKKIFAEIDTVSLDNHSKRELTIHEIDSWCSKTNAKL